MTQPDDPFTRYILPLLRRPDVRRRMLLALPVGLLLAAIIILGTPREYTARILFTAQNTWGRSATLTGMDFEAAIPTSSDRDAIRPSLYPYIVSSAPFLTDLATIPVWPARESGIDTIPLTLGDYLGKHQRRPWWSTVTSLPSRLMGAVFSLLTGGGQEDEVSMELVTPSARTENDPNAPDDPYGLPYASRLTRREAGTAAAVNSRISVEIDKKKFAIRLSVTMQDPRVAAQVADSVRSRIHRYVSDYRTRKARRALRQAGELHRETRRHYLEAQQRHAAYADTHQSLSGAAARAELINLEIAKQQAYTAYTRATLQVQQARTRVAQATPMQTVIHPAQVPLRPVRPRKAMVLVVCLLLCEAVAVGWELCRKFFRRGMLRPTQQRTPAQG